MLVNPKRWDSFPTATWGKDTDETLPQPWEDTIVDAITNSGAYKPEEPAPILVEESQPMEEPEVGASDSQQVEASQVFEPAELAVPDSEQVEASQVFEPAEMAVPDSQQLEASQVLQHAELAVPDSQPLEASQVLQPAELAVPDSEQVEASQVLQPAEMAVPDSQPLEAPQVLQPAEPVIPETQPDSPTSVAITPTVLEETPQEPKPKEPPAEETKPTKPSAAKTKAVKKKQDPEDQEAENKKVESKEVEIEEDEDEVKELPMVRREDQQVMKGCKAKIAKMDAAASKEPETKEGDGGSKPGRGRGRGRGIRKRPAASQSAKEEPDEDAELIQSDDESTKENLESKFEAAADDVNPPKTKKARKAKDAKSEEPKSSKETKPKESKAKVAAKKPAPKDTPEPEPDLKAKAEKKRKSKTPEKAEKVEAPPAKAAKVTFAGRRCPAENEDAIQRFNIIKKVFQENIQPKLTGAISSLEATNKTKRFFKTLQNIFKHICKTKSIIGLNFEAALQLSWWRFVFKSLQSADSCDEEIAFEKVKPFLASETVRNLKHNKVWFTCSNSFPLSVVLWAESIHSTLHDTMRYSGDYVKKWCGLVQAELWLAGRSQTEMFVTGANFTAAFRNPPWALDPLTLSWNLVL